ncbi:MAG: chemotaxis response regulator protein-glutamate methylesterase [Synergistales bacterium]
MDASGKIRVLVTDDSAFVRTLLADCLAENPDVEVAGTARNGEEALAKVRKLAPDVITLDVEMPLLNGIETLERLMRETPLPVIMLSSLTSKGAETTIRCLEAGAFDFIEKPVLRGGEGLTAFRRTLAEKVRAAARSGATARMRAKNRPADACFPRAEDPLFLPWNRADLILVAASTGGPRALSTLLAGLPADFPCPVLVVQHMPKTFTAPFAGRLDQISPLRVVEAYEGFKPVAGTVAIAPGDSHLLLKGTKGNLTCSLSALPPVNSVRPAADILFQSAALIPDLCPITVILTGMGRDGTEGVRALKRHKTVVLAESEESATVWGMPRAAREAGLVNRMLPLDRIAGELIRLARSRMAETAGLDPKRTAREGGAP